MCEIIKQRWFNNLVSALLREGEILILRLFFCKLKRAPNLDLSESPPFLENWKWCQFGLGKIEPWGNWNYFTQNTVRHTSAGSDHLLFLFSKISEPSLKTSKPRSLTKLTLDPARTQNEEPFKPFKYREIFLWFLFGNITTRNWMNQIRAFDVNIQHSSNIISVIICSRNGIPKVEIYSWQYFYYLVTNDFLQVLCWVLPQ